jgi:hypothetical protein
MDRRNLQSSVQPPLAGPKRNHRVEVDRIDLNAVYSFSR